jgi:hypothetical protein
MAISAQITGDRSSPAQRMRAAMSQDQYARFKNLTYAGFRDLATDDALSPYERIGFPDSYRAGKERAIFADIRSKLTNLENRTQVILDVGPGCTDVPRMMIELATAQTHRLLLVDSPEMLQLLPDEPHTTKYGGRFPEECAALVKEYAGKIDVILVYSVFHYIYAEGNVFTFIDACLNLLAPRGQLLIGDIPNSSKRKRFFSSMEGIRFHCDFTGTETVPEVHFNRVEPGEIDDGVVMGILLRVRAAGFDAYVVPQAPELPMANRREDLLIRRP